MSWLAAHWLPLLSTVMVVGASVGLVIVWARGRSDRRETRRVAAETRAAFERDRYDFTPEELGVWAALISMARYGEDASADHRP